jgi:polar amino acid transport system permease protein
MNMRRGSATLAAIQRRNPSGSMHYVFQFGDVWAAWRDLLWGTWLTVQLSAISMVLGLLVAVFGALGKTAGPKPVRWLVDAYVEVIRNTPFLVQIFIIFFGLPRAGVMLSSNQAALLAMVVNVGAYATEIVRAGIESIGRGQIEAGLALGLRPLQVFRYVVLFPAISAVYPALCSQFILLMLNSSVVSTISAQELTATANDLQARTFRSFEIYLVVTAIYLALSLLFSSAFGGIRRAVFARPGVR